MMDFIKDIPLIGGTVYYGLAFMFVLGIVVSVHEYGHYIIGRWCGIKAEVFSIGFGRELVHRVDRHGTRWRIGILPLGGYVKFVGDRDASSTQDATTLDNLSTADRSVSFAAAALWKRAATVFAGPAFNFILSTIVFAGLVMNSGIGVQDPVLGPIPESVQSFVPLQEGDEVTAIDGQPIEDFTGLYSAAFAEGAADGQTVSVIRDGRAITFDGVQLRPVMVSGVRYLTAASRAGVMPGDVITHVDGEAVPSFNDLKSRIMGSAGELTITLRRGSEVLNLPMTPTLEDVPQPDGSFEQQVIIGVDITTYLQPTTRSPGPAEALWIGVQQTIGVIGVTFDGIGLMVSGEVSAKNVNGPLGIAMVSGEAAAQGFLELVGLVAMISALVGMMNLLPIPILDGGHLLFYAIEAVTGKPPHGKVQEYATTIGFALIMSLMFFALYNDLARL